MGQILMKWNEFYTGSDKSYFGARIFPKWQKHFIQRILHRIKASRELVFSFIDRDVT